MEFYTCPCYMSTQGATDMVKESFVVNVDNVVDELHKQVVVVRGLPYVCTSMSDGHVTDTNAIEDIMTNKHREYLLFRYIDFFRSLDVGDLQEGLNYEHVFFCFEEFPHIESLLRNNIVMLGESWSHTIVCYQGNQAFVHKMASSIHPSIRVIVLEDDHMFIDDYNNYCLDASFYRNFTGEYLFFSDAGGLLIDNVHPEMFAAKPQFDGVAMDGNIVCSNFSIRNRRMVIESLPSLVSFNRKPYGQNVAKIKESCMLQSVPENVFFEQLLGSRRKGSSGLENKVLIWKSFLTNDENIDITSKSLSEDKFVLYLESLLKLYF